MANDPQLSQIIKAVLELAQTMRETNVALNRVADIFETKMERLARAAETTSTPRGGDNPVAPSAAQLEAKKPPPLSASHD